MLAERDIAAITASKQGEEKEYKVFFASMCQKAVALLCWLVRYVS